MQELDRLARRAPLDRRRAGRARRQAHRDRRTAVHDHRRAGAGRAAGRQDDARPSCARRSRGSRSPRRRSRWEVMGTYIVAGHRAHPVRRRPSAVRARPAAHRAQRLDAGEDDHRLHGRAQHHARASRPSAMSTRPRRRSKPRSPSASVSRAGDRPLVARRDELHHSPRRGWWRSRSGCCTGSASPRRSRPPDCRGGTCRSRSSPSTSASNWGSSASSLSC